MALVGCGRVGQLHADILGRRLVNGAELAAACDIDVRRAEIVASRFGCPAFSDLQEMMRSVPDVDVVSVLTESGHHARDAIALAPYGKHLLVEKPMALRLADTTRMIDACHTHGCQLFVVHQNRFNWAVRQLSRALKAGALGRPFLLNSRLRWCREEAYYQSSAWRGTWRLDGGVLANQGIHYLDLMLWLMGPAAAVSARAINAMAPIEAEDSAVVLIEFASGAIGSFEATTAARPVDLEGSLTVIGTRGVVEISGTALDQVRTWNCDLALEPDPTHGRRLGANWGSYGIGHLDVYEEVVQFVRTGAPPQVDGAEARKGVQLLHAIYASVESGAWARLEAGPESRLLGSDLAEGNARSTTARGTAHHGR